MGIAFDSGMMIALQGAVAPSGPADPDLNTGAGYWAAYSHDFPNLTGWSTFGGPTATSNEARLPTTTYAGINTSSNYNITDSSVYFKVSFAGSAGGRRRAYAQLRSEGNDTRNLQLDLDKTNSAWSVETSGSSIGTTNLATGTYDEATMVYWRFKHRTARNQLIVESSADGTTWTERAAGAVPASFQLNNADVQFGSWDGGSGYVAFSKVNVAP